MGITHELRQLDVCLNQSRQVLLRMLCFANLTEKGEISRSGGRPCLHRGRKSLKTDRWTSRPESKTQSKRDVTIKQVAIYVSGLLSSLTSPSKPSSFHLQRPFGFGNEFQGELDISRVMIRPTFSRPKPYALRMAVPISIHVCLFSAPCTCSPYPMAWRSGSDWRGSRGRFSANSSNPSTKPTVGGAPRLWMSDSQPCYQLGPGSHIP